MPCCRGWLNGRAYEYFVKMHFGLNRAQKCLPGKSIIVLYSGLFFLTGVAAAILWSTMNYYRAGYKQVQEKKHI